HVLHSLVNACTRSIVGEDARAVCPELTVTQLLAQRGKGFVQFINRYHELSKAAEPNKLFSIPNAWWDEVVSDAEPPLYPKAKLMYEIATLYRADFAGSFGLAMIGSIGDDVGKNLGMKPVFVQNTDGFFARSMAQTMASLREKPLIRCKNCMKTPEEVGSDVRFMVCSACKNKLNITIHYCSQ
ncbi:hypothetical protein F5I97DRAFT_1811777, partial [Phlebopus sp. FC_14]